MKTLYASLVHIEYVATESDYSTDLIIKVLLFAFSSFSPFVSISHFDLFSRWLQPLLFIFLLLFFFNAFLLIFRSSFSSRASNTTSEPTLILYNIILKYQVIQISHLNSFLVRLI